MNWNKAGMAVGILLFCGSCLPAAWGQDVSSENGNDFIKSRSYIGFFGMSSTIDQRGDFNGGNEFQFGPTQTVTGGVTTSSNPEVDLIPSINRNFGFGGMVGRREGAWAVEISYWRSDHTATFSSGVTTPARLESVSVDFKRYFLTQLPTQPFVSLGISFPWLWVHNASFILDYQDPPDPVTGYKVLSVTDEVISGIGFNVGAGLEIYMGDGLSLVGGAYQRLTGFDQINGAAKIALNQMEFDDKSTDIGALEGNGLNLYVGTTVAFE